MVHLSVSNRQFLILNNFKRHIIGIDDGSNLGIKD
ncbi:MAG: hypothetical protein JW384_03319 [Nitrosomonadaceae bacterium]|nr:hypothetical protein [Nitrosomonadaceae bacterium]